MLCDRQLADDSAEAQSFAAQAAQAAAALKAKAEAEQKARKDALIAEYSNIQAGTATVDTATSAVEPTTSDPVSTAAQGPAEVAPTKRTKKPKLSVDSSDSEASSLGGLPTFCLFATVGTSGLLWLLCCFGQHLLTACLQQCQVRANLMMS